MIVSVVELGAVIAALGGLSAALVMIGRKLGAIELAIVTYLSGRKSYEERHVQHMRRIERYEQVKLAMAGAQPREWRDTGPITIAVADPITIAAADSDEFPPRAS